jgi:DNA-binding CsgD family transcriptional regulator
VRRLCGTAATPADRPGETQAGRNRAWVLLQRSGQAVCDRAQSGQQQFGRCAVLHAVRLAGPGATGQTAVILEVARPTEVAPLLLQTYDLTEREGHIAQLVLQGLSTDESATALFISALTVQQHLKAVFDKTGVHSRRDLVARIFAQQYLPRLRLGTRPGADGWFAERMIPEDAGTRWHDPTAAPGLYSS